MRDRVLPVGGHNDGASEIKVPDLPVRRGSQFVTQAEVDGQVAADVEVVLEEFGKIPVTGGVEAPEEVLFVENRDPQKQISQPVSAVRCA